MISLLNLTNLHKEPIRQKEQFKILGYLSNKRNRNDLMITKMIGESYGIMSRLNSVKDTLDERSRKIVINSQVISKIRYFAPYIAGESDKIKTKVHN